MATLGNYVYGIEGETLYINQFVSSELSEGTVHCRQQTFYPNDGAVKLVAEGVRYVALRIPSWCRRFTLNKPYRMEHGYAVTENDGSALEICFDMTPSAVYADPRVVHNTGRLCIMRGPVVYCAEGVDNGDNLHRFAVPNDFEWQEKENESFGLPTLEISCRERLPFDGALYAKHPPKMKDATLKLIPYNAFANRGETDMLVWLCAE